MGVGDLAALGLAVHLPRGRRPEPVDRVRLLEAERERVDPGGPDELEPAAAFEVDGAAMRLAPRHPEIPEDGEGDGPIHHVARQETEKAAGARRVRLDHRAQARRQLRGTADRAKVEEDAGREHLRRAALLHPVAEPPRPDAHRLAPLGVGGHDPPRALREADADERPVDLRREAREVGLRRPRRRAAAGPRTRARCPDPCGASAPAGPRCRRRASRTAPAADRPARAARWPARAPAATIRSFSSATMRPTSYGVPPSSTSRRTSAVIRTPSRARSSTDGASADLAGHRHRVRGLKPQEVVARHDADEAPGVHDRQVMDAAAGHLEERLEAVGAGPHRDQRRRHHVRRPRSRRVPAFRDDLAPEVSVRHDPHRGPVVPHDHDRPDTGRRHLPGERPAPGSRGPAVTGGRAMNSRTGCRNRERSSGFTMRRPSLTARGARASAAPPRARRRRRRRPRSRPRSRPGATSRSAMTGPRWRAGTASGGSWLSSQNSGISTTTGSPITTIRRPIAPRPTRRNGSSARDRCSTRTQIAVTPDEGQQQARPGTPPARRSAAALAAYSPANTTAPSTLTAASASTASSRQAYRAGDPQPAGRGESGSPARARRRRPSATRRTRRSGVPAAEPAPHRARQRPGDHGEEPEDRAVRPRDEAGEEDVEERDRSNAMKNTSGTTTLIVWRIRTDRSDSATARMIPAGGTRAASPPAGRHASDG